MNIILDPAMLAELLAGGVLIGAATAGLLLVNGHIAGISGIFARATHMVARAGNGRFWPGCSPPEPAPP